jgi:uncharacterized protein (TIGR02246 family)
MAAPRTRAAPLLASPDDIEAQFYDAMQQGDLERMMAVWADDDEIACVHPGGSRVTGPAAIRASLAAIFANGGVPVEPEQVRRMQTLSCAVHHLVERVIVPGPTGPRPAWVLATNVYVKTEEGWRMVVHHASPAVLDEPAAPAGEAPSTLH